MGTPASLIVLTYMGNKQRKSNRHLNKERKLKRRVAKERKKRMLGKLGVKATGRTDIDIESIKAAGKGMDNQDVPTEGRLDGNAIAQSGDPKVSLCMIVKDEEAVIARCLESLKGHVDEMVIVDTGSTDKTVEICESYGAKIYHHPWEGSFSVARNQAMSHVTTEWLIQLDADEEMDADSAPKIRDIVRSSHNSMTNICYLVLISKRAGSKDIFSMISTGKIIRMGIGIHYKNRIHNKLVYDGNIVGRLTGLKIYHYGYHLDDKEKMKMKRERTTAMLLEQIKELPEDPETRYYLSIQYLTQEKWDKCIECSKVTVELFLRHEPDSQLLLLTYHVAAVSYYHKKAENPDVKQKWLKEAERLCLETLKIYPDYLDSNSLLSSIYFATKQYEKCYETSTRFLNIADMLKKDPTKSLVIPLNTLKNEWMINLHLAINFYEQADQANAVNFLKRAEDCLEPDEKYKPSFTMFQYMFKRGDKASLSNAEAIYKGGFRAE